MTVFNPSGTSILCDKLPVIVCLSVFKNLQVLNLSDTELDSKCLEVIANDLVNLTSLNISKTDVMDISPLRRMRRRLQCLSMYGLKPKNAQRFVQVLGELRSLVYLDLSDDMPMARFSKGCIQDQLHKLFKSDDFLPNVEYIDLSGNKLNLYVNTVIDFVKKRPKIKFLGYCMADEELWAEQDFNRPDLEISGHSSDSQLVSCLKKYSDREKYIQQALYHIFVHTNHLSTLKEDLLLATLPVLKKYTHSVDIQMAGTAVLYNLTRNDLCTKLRPAVRNIVVDLVLTAMSNFPRQLQLQKNSLLTLCNDCFLHTSEFNRLWCCSLVCNTLHYFTDEHMVRMAVAIVSILSGKISTLELQLLCKSDKKNFCRLVGLVRSRCEQLRLQLNETSASSEPVALTVSNLDPTLKFTLSALWNLTDECESSCQDFIAAGGLPVYLDIFNIFMSPDVKRPCSEVRQHLFTKCLGLLNNISEVASTRSCLLSSPLLEILTQLLGDSSIHISYFAAGVLAHLSLEPQETWLAFVEQSAEVFMSQLADTVINWREPDTEMVAYRSFKPFIPLLQHRDYIAVDLWSLWAIKHVCNKDKDRYLPFLFDHNSILLQLIRLISNESKDTVDSKHKTLVNQLANAILDMIGERSDLRPTVQSRRNFVPISHPPFTVRSNSNLSTKSTTDPSVT